MGKVACFPIKTACTVLMQSLNKKAISRICGRGGVGVLTELFRRGFQPRLAATTPSLRVDYCRGDCRAGFAIREWRIRRHGCLTFNALPDTFAFRETRN